MPDLTPQLLPRLKDYRLPASSGAALAPGGDLIYPAYAGQSILNIPSSLCRLLGVPDFGADPLIPEILSPLTSSGPYQRVVLLLMDALSLHRFQNWMADGSLPVWKQLAQEGLFAPLTSIVPSTTTAALTSLWTGRSPAEHGVAGYELWLKEFGVVANMILHNPMSFSAGTGRDCLPGSLACAGFQPEAFLGHSTLGTHLADHGVGAYAFQHASILHSGLSRMFFQNVQTHAFSTPNDLAINLRHFMEATPKQRSFIWVYWGEVDHLSHFYGPDDERARAEFTAFSRAIEDLLLSRLSPAARQNTLFILTSDHGQITTRIDPFYDLRSHPNLVRRLHILPTGENRLAYFYIRPGQMEAVREYLERTWPRGFTLLDPPYAVEAGLFGPGPAHPRLLDRLGDLIALSRGENYLWWAAKENLLIGRHGGLSPEEMLVPFLAIKL